MAYIRVKKIGSAEYLYLVKSVWDRKRGTSRQEIIKYLGAAPDLAIGDIPEEYRGAPKVLEFLASRSGGDADVAVRARERLYSALTRNDLDGALAVYEEVSAAPGTVEAFFDAVFRPVMQDIGQRWAEGRIDITTEHVASNVANSVVRRVRDRRDPRRGRTSVVLCVPPGEKHHMGCDVLETYLASRGFVVYNLGYEMPSTEVMEFLGRNRPDAVAVSASGEYSLLPAKKMADNISGTYGIPVILGGYAFRDGSGGIERHTVCSETSLKDVPRAIRRAVAGARQDARATAWASPAGASSRSGSSPAPDR